MKKTAYQIKNWDEHFEVSQSRRAPKRLTWVAFPNKHDGKGYRRITQHPKATDIFTAWVLIAQVASKMQKRGLLVDGGNPLDSEDLSAKTGFRKEIFDLAFEILVQPKIGWLEMVEIKLSESDISAL